MRGHRGSAAVKPVDGILVVGDEPTVLAARAAAALGLSGNPAEAARASRDKRRSREALRAADLPVPVVFVRRLDEDPASVATGFRIPCVVKPLALSASRGVMRADSPDAFVEAFGAVAAHPRRRTTIRRTRDPAARPGDDRGVTFPVASYALEGLMDRGRLASLAIFDKPDPLDGPFFEETIYVTPLVAPGGRAGSHRRDDCRGGGAWASSTGRSTPSAASTSTASSCSRSPRAPSAGCADDALRFAAAAGAARSSRSRNCCCGTRWARHRRLSARAPRRRVS